jgi:hypothetical protein
MAPPSTPDPKNKSILALYNSLSAQQAALSAAIQKATDPNVADALSTESYEILHRIVLAQNLLFQSDSAALQQSVTAVTNASGQLQSTITNIQNVSNVIGAVSSYLGLVDQAIDLAKTLAPMAAG